MDYISTKEAAGKWKITQRRVEALCQNRQICNVERIGNTWLIPKGAVKPIDGRTKTAKQQKKTLEYQYTLNPDFVIEMVNGTMAIEGMPLTEEDRVRLRTVILGEVTADEMVRLLVSKHKRSAHA
jgi:hypothetical protein